MTERDPDAQLGDLLRVQTHGIHADLIDLLEVRQRVDALSVALASSDAGHNAPRADILDVGDAWQVRLEVPGVDLADLEIGLRGDTLTVAGVRRTVEDGVHAVQRERAHGPFQRELTLPGAVDAEGVSAHLRGGLLVVDLPKSA